VLPLTKLDAGDADPNNPEIVIADPQTPVPKSGKLVERVTVIFVVAHGNA